MIKNPTQLTSTSFQYLSTDVVRSLTLACLKRLATSHHHTKCRSVSLFSYCTRQTYQGFDGEKWIFFDAGAPLVMLQICCEYELLLVEDFENSGRPFSRYWALSSNFIFFYHKDDTASGKTSVLTASSTDQISWRKTCWYIHRSDDGWWNCFVKQTGGTWQNNWGEAVCQ